MKTGRNQAERCNPAGGPAWRVFCLGALFALSATFLPAQIEVTVRPRAALIETSGSLTATAQVSGLVTGQRGGVNWSVNGFVAGTVANFPYSPSFTPEDVSIILRASSLADQSRFGALPVIRLLRSERTQVNFPQAVTYHPSTQRIYVAALVARGTVIDTDIFEIDPSGSGSRIGTLTSELIDKLVPYRSASGVPYLLGVSISTNSVQAVNLGTRTARRVVGGLRGPVSGGIHPDSGDLYIAEQTGRRVSVVTRAALDTAIGATGTATAPFGALPITITGVSGVGFLRVGEDRRVSLLITSTTGALYQVDLRDNTFNVVASGLRSAQEIQVVESSQLDASFGFIASPPGGSLDGQGIIAAVVPGGPGQPLSAYSMATGLDAPTDVTFLPAGNPYSSTGRPTIVAVNSSATPSRGKIIFWEIDPLSPSEFYSYTGRAIPSIRLVSPADGDTLQPGFPTEIRWKYSDANQLNAPYAPYQETVNVSVSTDGGTTFSPVGISYVPAVLSGQEYKLVWHVPADLAGSAIRLRVETRDLEGKTLSAANAADLTVLQKANTISSVLSLNPNFALIGQQAVTSVAVSGLNFQPGTTVAIEGISSGSVPTQASPARLLLNILPGSAVSEGPKNVSICVGPGNCELSKVPFFALSSTGPILTAVEPNGAAPGAVVRIRGNNFSVVGANNRVVFGNRPGAVLLAEPESLIVQIPYGLSGGKSSVQVETNGVASNSLDFIIVSHALEFPATINLDGIVNAASYAPGTLPLAPGSIASLFGLTVAPGNADASVIPLERELLNTTVLIGGMRAPLFALRQSQINFQLPEELLGLSSVPAVIVSRGEAGNTVSLNLATQRPGIFSADSTGEGLGAIINQNGTPNGPQNRAPIGSAITIYATGLGGTEPPVPTGTGGPTAEPLARHVLRPQVTIGGIPAAATFSGRAPGFVGLDQINAAVPAGVSTQEAVPVVLITPQGSSKPVLLFVAPAGN